MTVSLFWAAVLLLARQAAGLRSVRRKKVAGRAAASAAEIRPDPPPTSTASSGWTDCRTSNSAYTW